MWAVDVKMPAQLPQTLCVNMERTDFLNVDLDIESKIDIKPIVDAFGEHLTVMRNDCVDGVFYGSFETAYSKIDEIIAEYERLVISLEPGAKEVWNGCSVRRFDFGYECGKKPRAYNSTLSKDIVSKISDIGGEIGITIYAYNEENS